MRKFLSFLFACLYFSSAFSQLQTLSGRITNQNNIPIGFASIYIKNSTYGTAANENGSYLLRLKPGTYDIVYRHVGYKEQIDRITITYDDVRDVKMTEDLYQLKQVVVNGKKIDSAEEIIKKVIDKRLFYLNQVKTYSCAVYVKGVQRLANAPKNLMGQDVARAMDLDTNRQGILYQSESLSKYNFELPDRIKEVMIAAKVAGQNTAFSFNKASDMDVNFYRNTFVVPGLSSHGFVSPVAEKALNYYHYKLLGSKVDNGVLVYKIQIIPKNEHEAVFTGTIYIVAGDWRIYSADLYLTKKANNLNLVDSLEVSLQYVPVTDSIWLPLSTQYSFEGKVLGFSFKGYYLGIYNNYNLNPSFPANYFNGEVMRIDASANKSDSVAYWRKIRPVPLTTEEYIDYIRKEADAAEKSTDAYLDTLQKTKNKFPFFSYIPFGYNAASKNNRDSVFLYPLTQTLYYNTVEGLGLNIKARYSHYYNDMSSYSITPDLRYGLADKLLNANIHAQYFYDPWHQAKFFGGFGSDVLDLNNAGTRSLYFNSLSTLLSARNYVKYYHSQFGDFGYQLELANGILWVADLNYATRTQLFNNSYYSFSGANQLTSNNPLKSDVPGVPDAPATDRSILFPKNQALTFYASFTFTFDQKYITTPSGRTYEPSPYPQIVVNYRKGINAAGSDVNYDFASVQVLQNHLDAGLLGYSSFSVTTGDFFNRSKLYYMDYFHFAGNQGTTFDPTIGSFHFLPFYTYSTDAGFLEGHFEHNFSGLLFNHIDFLRQLKLEEIIGTNYLTERANGNYAEFYVGIQRLIFRLDYGLSYEGNHRYIQGLRLFYGIK